MGREPGIAWLLQSNDPSIRYFATTEFAELDLQSSKAEKAKKLIPQGSRFRALLEDQQPDGGFGVHPYQKWTGAHWRLVSLVELGCSPGFRPAVRATDLVLKWLRSDSHIKKIQRINGRYRRCASQEGNALAVCSRLGLANDLRVQEIADSLLEWQWPDGGWNCDKKPEAEHSSVNETLSTLWGLVEYYCATRDDKFSKPIDAASEFFLKHQLYRSEHSGKIIHTEMVKLHYPLYWHCDILQELLILARAGRLSDPRTKGALDLVEKKQGRDGLWRPEGYYWSMRRKSSNVNVSNVEIVDWGRNTPNEFVTLNALRVLKASGRVQVS